MIMHLPHRIHQKHITQIYKDNKLTDRLTVMDQGTGR